MKLTVIGCILLFVPFLLMGQGRKTIQKKEVVSQTTMEYFLAEGMKEPLVEKIQTYDSLGNVIEIKEFNKKGDVTLWEMYRYNEDEDLVEEKFLDGRGQLVERIAYLYQDGLVVEKQYYDRKERLYKKKEYVYEYSGKD